MTGTRELEEPEHHRVDELLLDEITDQLDRTRRLLMGNPEAAAEAALARAGRQREAELRIARELAVTEPLAEPERFPEAHRLVVRALEVLDREGSRDPAAPAVGPLGHVLALGIHLVADYIVKSYARDIVTKLQRLYARREAQCPPERPERRYLARARTEMDRLAPGFAGGGMAAPLLVGAGAALPLLASVTDYLGAIDLRNPYVGWAGLIGLFLVFLALSTLLLRGAAVAHRRSRLIMEQPLAALWQTVGAAGDPPKDRSVTIATIAVALTALGWVVLPVGAVLVLVFD